MKLLIGFNSIQENMNLKKINEVTHLLMKVREVTNAHLPISHSIIPYQILLVVMYHHIRNEKLSVKQLFNSGSFSEMGNRYHYRILLENKWIHLEDNPADFRLKLITPSEKLLQAFSVITGDLETAFSEVLIDSNAINLHQSISSPLSS